MSGYIRSGSDTDIDFSKKTIRVVGKGSKERLANFDSDTKDLMIEYLTSLEKYPLVRTNFNNNLFVDEGFIKI